MIFAEVASRVGLLGKVNLPREPREGEKRERPEMRSEDIGWKLLPATTLEKS